MGKELKVAMLGKMRSGKDTAAALLIEEYNFKKYGFGDAIGGVIDTYFPTARLNGKPRKHYQVIGQSFRMLDENIWVNLLFKKIKEDKQKETQPFNVVITDVRQLNEVAALKEEGYTIIKIVADDTERVERIKKQGDVFNAAAFEHETEVGVDAAPYDYMIINNGTIEDLHKEVQNIINKMIGEK